MIWDDSISILMRQYATGSGSAIALTITPAMPYQLKEIRIHLAQAAGSNVFSATLDSGLGAAYDAVLCSQNLSGLTDYNKLYDTDCAPTIHGDDSVVFASAGSITGAWAIEVWYRQIAEYAAIARARA